MKSAPLRRLILPLVLCLFYGTWLHASELHQEDGILPAHSAEYVRTLNRNASTDADASFYNPAGLAMMEKTGLYINFNTQTLYKKRLHSMDFYHLDVSGDLPLVGEREISTDTASSQPGFVTNRATGSVSGDKSYYAQVTAPVVPDLNIVYRGHNFGQDWAAWLSLGIMQAAPDFTFPRGLAVVDWGNLTVGEQINSTSNESLSSLSGSSAFNSYTYDSNKAVRTEYFIGTTLGASYRIIDMLSAAFGFRYIYYTGAQSIRVKGVTETFTSTLNLSQDLFDGVNSDWDIETEYSGHGFGFITGIDVRPLSLINIGLRYEYYLPATLKKKTKAFVVNELIEQSGQLDIFKDGAANDDFNGGSGYSHGNGTSKLKVTYPQSLSLGVSYMVLDDLKLETGADMYLRPLVDLDGREKDYHIGYRLGLCAEYTFLKDYRTSLGYSFNDPGIKNSARNEIDPLLMNHTIAMGGAWRYNDRLEVNLGFMYVFYMNAKVTQVIPTSSTMEAEILFVPTTIEVDAVSYIKKEMAERTFSVALGVTYRFLGEEIVPQKEDKKKRKGKMTL